MSSDKTENVLLLQGGEIRLDEGRRLGRRVTSTYKLFVIFLCHYPQPHSSPPTRRDNMGIAYVLRAHAHTHTFWIVIVS